MIPTRQCVGLELALCCYLCILKPFDEGPCDCCVSGEHHCLVKLRCIGTSIRKAEERSLAASVAQEKQARGEGSLQRHFPCPTNLAFLTGVLLSRSQRPFAMFYGAFH